MDNKMKSNPSEPAPQIPPCKIRGRLLSAHDFVPRLKKLCSALGFNNPIIEKMGKLHVSSERSTSGKLLSSHFQPHGRDEERDWIIILSTTVPYEQSWGGYSGLPGQYFSEQSATRKDETPSDFIRPYLWQYRFAQEHIFLGTDHSGRFVVNLPDYLVSEHKSIGGGDLRVLIGKIAEPNADGQFVPLSVSGSTVTFPLASHFRHAIGEERFSSKIGIRNSIGEHLRAELFQFAPLSGQGHTSNPFATMLLPLMPWIVTHTTPHLAATLVHLQSNFLKFCEAFAATGTDDLRNLLCVAGLDIDMRGFRGRSESYFVPWQACWKRHGYCYDDIYPLSQDDLLVALNSLRWEKGQS